MCVTVEEAREHVLALLLRGRSPEDVEQLLERPEPCVLDAVQARTALSDPTNVMMQEVTQDGSAN